MTVQDDPVIVQFLHPGSEKVSKIQALKEPYIVAGTEYGLIRPWSQQNEMHGRKFIRISGDYCDGRQSIREDKMNLWAEAEWDTVCRPLGQQGDDVTLPQYEHLVRHPYGTAFAGCINTDPYIFGGAFKYCCCKQSYRDGRPTFLHELPIGSIILFGSYKKTNDGDGFYLDTVFVVGKRIGEYTNGAEMCRRLKGMDEETQKLVSPLYQKRVLLTIGGNDKGQGCLSSAAVAKKSATGRFVLYAGRVFDSHNPQEPFSFVPVIPGCFRYARPRLSCFKDAQGREVINPAMHQGVRKISVSRGEIPVVWENLLKAIPEEYRYAWHIDE